MKEQDPFTSSAVMDTSVGGEKASKPVWMVTTVFLVLITYCFDVRLCL